MLVRIALLATVALGCRGALARPPAEEQRIRSPDGRVDAVVYRTRTDPLSSDVLSVRLEPIGARAEHDQAVLHAEHTGLKIRWLQDRLLEVAYNQGEISGFYNTWWTREVDPAGNATYFVEVLLVKRPVDAPAHAADRPGIDRR
jgi:hypothetical protein